MIPFHSCWEWAGAKDTDGYGVLVVDYIPKKAHRLSFQFKNGPIPKGMMVCHRCDNPGCVRPEHLFLGTAADNSKDCWGKGRGKTPIRGKR